MAYEIEKISEGNVDTPLTNFPVGEDTFPRMSDVSVTLLPLVLQYNNYCQNGQLALAKQLLVSNPELDACLHNAEKWNMIRDAIIAMQRFLLNQVDSLYNEILNAAKENIGISDNPPAGKESMVAYSAAKVDSLLSQYSNVDNTADADKSVKYATNAGTATSANKATTLDGLTASVTELNYVDGVTSNIQTQLNGKQDTIKGGATSITGNNLTANRALVSDGNGKVAVSAVTSTELGYLDGVKSSIQTQLDDKAVSGHTHNYAASTHTHAASQVTAGTLGGKVVANASAVETVTDKQVRNIFANTIEATSGSAFSGLSNGDIYLQYEMG